METTETLGKYEIRGQLGRGAMGVVLDGWDPAIQRRVAIKTVPIVDTSDPEMQDAIARFKREAQAAGRLTHPNIVGVYDYGETDDLAYIVMEFVEGPTLKSLMEKRERFAVPEILRIMDDLLTGLEFSHERGVIHRDVKPANLMLTSDDRAKARAKIADFGIARVESSSMTQAGTVIGTPAYMSPEQFMGETVDARTDIYSSGVLLYQLLTGERPFEGGLSAIMQKALHTDPLPPSKISVTCPASMDAVVRKAMAKRPAERYATAGAFQRALHDAAANSAAEEELGEATMVRPKPVAEPVRTVEVRAPAPDPAVTQRKGSAAVWGAAGAVAVLLAAGGGAYFFMSGGTKPQSPAVSISASAPVLPPVAKPAAPVPIAKPGAAPFAPPATSPVGTVAPPAAPAVTPRMIAGMYSQITAIQSCAWINGSVGDNDQAVLRGIAGPGVESQIRQDMASRDVPGTMVWHVAAADPVYCPVLNLLQSIAPPFGDTGSGVGLTLAGDRMILRTGERVRPRLTIGNFPGYVRMDYIQHDGTVLHLFPQVADSAGAVADKDRLFAVGEKLNLGDAPPPHPAWVVGAPYGTDMIVTIVSSVPLFTAPRAGNVEKLAPYLRDLDAAVRAVQAGGGKLAGRAILVETVKK